MKESALRFNGIKHNSSDGLRIEQRDWLWSGLGDVAAAVAFVALVCVSLGTVKDAFTRALSHLHPGHGMPTLGE